jgi:two-component system nitrate/nitrite response regulator NarL
MVGAVGERVFLCDDDDGYRMLLREILGAEGMEIVGEGGDGWGCVRAARAADPDVVLLDLNMPGMNGFETLPPLRAGLPNAKLIVLSASPADRQSVAAAHMLGADGYVSKPFDIFTLPTLLRQALAA